MADIYLEFEKPISELRKKIEELEKLSQNSQIDVSDELKALNAKLTKMTKDIYTHLSPWQRIQLSQLIEDGTPDSGLGVR